MEQNIYLINGFLESGKTTLIKKFLSRDSSNIKGKNLVIVCEEGDESYDKVFCQEHNTIIQILETANEFTMQNIKKIVAEINPERIFIEFNGMWDVSPILNQWDFGTITEIVIFDAQCFEIYSNNLKSFIINQIRNANMTIFRSCDGKEKQLARYRRSVRAVNPQTAFIFQTDNGEIEPRLDDDLPYNINNKLLVLPDRDFGIFYIDAMEYVRRYIGKRVCFRGCILKKRKNMLLIGWQAITCCMEDLTVFAFICDTEEADYFFEQQWVRIEGVIQEEYFEKVNSSIPIINILWMQEEKSL